MAGRNKRFKSEHRQTRFEDGEREQKYSSSKTTILFTLENNKRYAQTAANRYQITMASLQPDERRLPHCLCNKINEEKQPKGENDNRVVVIIEHNLNEYILCILDAEKLRECKLNLIIEPGEQIAFRTIGKTPVQLAGTIGKAN